MSTIKSSSEHLTLNADGSGKDINLQANGSTKVTVKSDGNVGIGTSSPISPLDVNGEVRSRSLGFTLIDGTTVVGRLIKHKEISGSGTDNTPCLFSETGNGLAFMTNGSATERMRIDSAGRVTMPYQPYAFVDFGGGAYAAYSGIVPFDNILANQGNHYNTSTYKFTCPVDGIYSVQVGVLSQNPTDSYHADVYHNGVSVTRNHCTYRSTQASSNIKCSANDTLWIQTDSINLYGGNGTSTYCRAIYTLLG